MAMVVKNNLSAVRTLNILNSNSAALQKGMARVSSGMKITGAQDDAAGFAISERMRVRIRALDQANQNSQNDSSLMKTAEGAVGNTIDILKALKEKCINAANDSNTDEDRQTIQKEIDQYIDQIDDNAQVTFNGKSLIDGTKNNAAVATKTVLLNQSLKAGTQASDKLTTLANRVGDSLGIQSTDYYQVSWVQNGQIHTTSGQVKDASLKDIVEGALTIKNEDGTETKAGVIAATSKDGLIGDSDVDPMTEQGYAATSMTAVENGKGLTEDAVIAMFSGVDDDVTDTAATTDTGDDITCQNSGGAAVVLSADLATASDTDFPVKIEGYSIKNADNEAQAVTIEISRVTTDGTDVAYNVSVVDENGEEIDTTNPLTLYKTDVKNYTDEYLEAGFTIANSYAAGGSDLPDVDGIKAAGSGLGSNAGVKFADINPSDGTTSIGAGKTYYIKDGDSYTELPDAGLYKDGTAAIYMVKDVSQGAASKLTSTDVLYYRNPYYKEESTPSVVDKYNKALYTPDKTQGIAFVASEAGVDKQIAGLTINILDQDLNVKKSANASLDQFKQYQRAENKTGDNALNFQLGSEANQSIKVGFTDMRSQALGLKGSDGTRINVYTKENANASINVIENAITKALDQQTTIGAVESRLEYTSANLTTASENVQASESTIRDADMAKEMTNYTKANVLLQAAQAMLAQANQSSSSVLSLLQ